MTEPTLVFDIETIPDIAGARRILEMPDAPATCSLYDVVSCSV